MMQDDVARRLGAVKFRNAELNAAALAELESRIARAARSDRTGDVTYGDLVRHVKFRTHRREFLIEGPGFAPFHRRFLAGLLAELSKRTYLRAGFFAGALVVNKLTHCPSETFFRWVEGLGALPRRGADEDRAFLEEQRAKAHEWYAQTSDPAQDELMAALVERGVVARVPSRKMTSAEFRAWQPVQIDGPSLSDMLIEERR
jgi:hypothetical protein